jgi:hypothetical protein
MSALPEDSILKNTLQVHERLLMSINEVSAQSGVPVSMIHKSSVPYLTEQELDWVLNDWPMTNSSACLSGALKCSATTKFMAMAAIFIRNYKDARVVTLGQVLAGEVDTLATLLFIPNFYVKGFGKPLAFHQVQTLHDFLVKRITRNRATVVYVENLDLLATDYGSQIRQHFDEHYRLLTEV